MTLTLVLLSVFLLCACSKKAHIHVPETTTCLKYNIGLRGDDQTLSNPVFQKHFKEALTTELADQGLRLCEDEESSDYGLSVHELREDYKNADLRPAILSSGNPAYDVISGVVVWATVNTSKAVSRLANDTDYRFRYSLALSHGKVTRWLVRDERPHYKTFDDDAKESVMEHYTEFAAVIGREIAQLRKEAINE